MSVDAGPQGGVPIGVWAPQARAVEVVIERAGERVRQALSPGAGGWWSGPRVASGTDYSFSLDGGPARPDPRSRWQPHGVHGASRALDLAALRAGRRSEPFRAPPLAAALIYELHVGTFSRAGTFDGVIEHLDHLVDLGVTHVELMPVAAFPGRRGWGYDGVALYAPHDGYGGPAGLVRLVDACHQRGLAVLLDVVYNHLGSDGNYLREFGPYFSARHHTPWGEAVNLDGPGADEVRRWIIDNAIQWLRDYRFDGLRLDAVHALCDTTALPLLEQLAGEVRALAAAEARPLVLIGESDLNDPRVVRAPEAGGLGLDAQWSDDFHHALHVALTGEQSGYYVDFDGVADLARAFAGAYVYSGQHSRHRGRAHGRPVDELPGERFLGYAQTHDQVGNRAHGDRLVQLAGVRLAKVGAALVMVAPFVPLWFQGEEWGASTPFQYFTDHQSSELAEAVRAGRRAEFAAFGWAPDDIPDPQDEATFTRSRLDWDERERAAQAAVLAWYRALAQLRAAQPALRDGRRDLVSVLARHDAKEHWIEVTRGPVTLIANLGGSWVERPRPAGRMLLASEPGVADAGELATLPHECAAFWLA